MQYDFLIVGGGVAGGVLAGLLGRQGKRVLVLEKATEPAGMIRPEIVWPATTEVLGSLIPAERLAADVLLRLGSVEVRGGNGESLLLSRAFLDGAGIERCSLEPNKLREQLLSLDSFELRRGVEVTGLLRERGRVVGARSREVGTDRQHEFLARHTVGNDGVHSFVRREGGLPMRTRMFPLDFLCFGFVWPSIRRRWGHAPRYGCDGLILMGYAAHPVSPVGGQGTNMAVADAATFADLVQETVPDLLGEYERRRRPGNERSLRFTRNAARLLQLPSYCLPGFALRGAFRWVCRHPSALVNTIRYASTAFRANTERLSPGSVA